MFKKNKGLKLLIIFLIIVIIFCGILLVIKFINNKALVVNENVDSAIFLGQEEAKVKEKPINIFSGDDRPIAVMIDNHKDAWPQGGLNQAYIVYEIIVEGQETRIMALFKGKDIEKIGPVRSSRHYFLDYALENDAIYVHYGWSPQAQSDISKYKVNNINGITQSSSSFWRAKDKSAPHNAVTKTSEIIKIAEKLKYNIKSNEKSVLNYKAEEVNIENGQVATKVTIPYSSSHKVSYKYNVETKLYTRYARETVQKDWITSENVTTKNIIITFAKNYTLNDSENKGRQGLENVGTLDGYYITNGKAEKIRCIKESRTAKTVYQDLNGNVINVNDGNTFIQICPIDSNVTFE